MKKSATSLLMNLENFEMIAGPDIQQSELEILPLEREDIPAVVKLHRQFLNYSINSRLGAAHLSYIYEMTRKDRASVVLVAKIKKVIVGVVSATLDPERLSRSFLMNLTISGWLRLFLNLIAKPYLLIEWFRDRDAVRPVFYEGKAVIPCLTAIIVTPKFRRSGIGRMLLDEVENFCRENGCHAFRLDTRQDNHISRNFYKKLGFVEAEQRGRNILLVKAL